MKADQYITENSSCLSANYLHDHIANAKSVVLDPTVDLGTRTTELEKDTVKPE